MITTFRPLYYRFPVVFGVYGCLSIDWKVLSPFLCRNIKLSGAARVILTPTLSKLPLVGGVQLMFLTTPQLDFDFVGAARIASKLPAIKNKIKSELLSELSQELIYPRRLVLPLSQKT